MAAVAEDELDSTHFESLLDAKLDPITKAIERLERQQERIVELIANQAVIMANARNLEDNFNRAIEDNTKIHDALFTKIRDNEESIDSIKKDSGNKLWDAMKIVIAGLFGGVVAWLAGNR